MEYIVLLKKLSDKNIHMAGGKGSSLSHLLKAGLPVPNGFVILSEAFEDGVLNNNCKELLEKFILKLPDNHTYAVRSSAVGEDGENASFAGAYDTILDVKKEDIAEAVNKVAKSAESERVKNYSDNINAAKGKIAVVVQQFVNPQYAGVLFTSDIITGSSAKMIGNYVCGVGETLVSGSANAEEFTFNSLKYQFNGDKKIKPYAKKLYGYAVKIKELFGCPQDIEWAASDGKVYILQARPITTLRRYNPDTYEINGSLSGEYLFSKTNVGEIFTRPLSPATYSILEEICNTLGMPCFIDNIYGQAYCNLSVVCSLLVSFGLSRKKAYEIISDIAGNIPDNMEIPIFPFNKKLFMHQIKALIFSKKPKSANMKMSKKEFTNNIAGIGDKLIEKIHSINNNQELLDFWTTECSAYISRVLGAIVSSLSMKQLLNSRNKISKIAGEELANELCSNCSSNGILESMKPLLGIADIISGKISKEDYVKKYGHRSPDEMELSCPYPYENPDFPNNLIEDYIKSGVDVYKMKALQEEHYYDAVKKFKQLYPNKAKWLDKKLSAFAKATYVRENVRSQSVKIFCMMREFLLRASKLNNLGEDVFMLHLKEIIQILAGDTSAIEKIPARKKNYEHYLSMPKFPNTILGRFEPDKWLADKNRRKDYFIFGENNTSCKNDVIKGYAGAVGIATGRVRVLDDLSKADEICQGEILVATATNIGWTTIFTKVSAIVTDIGAPLSHAAIVAREFGIPAVVGCGNATQMLKTGDIVQVDGIHGIITKL